MEDSNVEQVPGRCVKKVDNGTLVVPDDKLNTCRKDKPFIDPACPKAVADYSKRPQGVTLVRCEIVEDPSTASTVQKLLTADLTDTPETLQSSDEDNFENGENEAIDTEKCYGTSEMKLLCGDKTSDKESKIKEEHKEVEEYDAGDDGHKSSVRDDNAIVPGQNSTDKDDAGDPDKNYHTVDNGQNIQEKASSICKKSTDEERSFGMCTEKLKEYDEKRSSGFGINYKYKMKKSKLVQRDGKHMKQTEIFSKKEYYPQTKHEYKMKKEYSIRQKRDRMLMTYSKHFSQKNDYLEISCEYKVDISIQLSKDEKNVHIVTERTHKGSMYMKRADSLQWLYEKSYMFSDIEITPLPVYVVVVRDPSDALDIIDYMRQDRNVDIELPPNVVLHSSLLDNGSSTVASPDLGQGRQDGNPHNVPVGTENQARHELPTENSQMPVIMNDNYNSESFIDIHAWSQDDQGLVQPDSHSYVDILNPNGTNGESQGSQQIVDTESVRGELQHDSIIGLTSHYPPSLEDSGDNEIFGGVENPIREDMTTPGFRYTDAPRSDRRLSYNETVRELTSRLSPDLRTEVLSNATQYLSSYTEEYIELNSETSMVENNEEVEGATGYTPGPDGT